ncbi:transcriptional regulator [Streptomyces sp. NPDC057638]|uniref:transcriptional regulator n=1 Tax=Streptomyces sp. NPDC057638 TaxID=3346190 RepID=UPI00367D11B2
MGPSRRTLLNAGVLSIATAIPAWNETVERIETTSSGRLRRMGDGEIAMVTAMTQRFSDLDYQLGGRGTRPVAAAFLIDTVVPLLSASGSEHTRSGMFSAAANLCYLIGYMAVDDEYQSLGQGYYLKAMELAKAANDRNAYSLALHGMSSQALQLGRHTTAVALTSAAMADKRTLESNVRAFLAGQLAYASALTGDSRSALSSLREAEGEMNKTASSSRVVMGRYREAVLEFDIAHVTYGLGDKTGSLESIKRYLELRDRRRDRRAVLDGALLAEREMELGHLEAACATWKNALRAYPAIQSGRVDRKITTMMKSLKPFLRNPTARALYEYAHEMTRQRPHARQT